MDDYVDELFGYTYVITLTARPEGGDAVRVIGTSASGEECLSVTAGYADPCFALRRALTQGLGQRCCTCRFILPNDEMLGWTHDDSPVGSVLLMLSPSCIPPDARILSKACVCAATSTIDKPTPDLLDEIVYVPRWMSEHRAGVLARKDSFKPTNFVAQGLFHHQQTVAAK